MITTPEMKIASVIGMLVVVGMNVKVSGINMRGLGWILLLGTLYPAGKTIQIWGIGPSMFRGYVSDVGFVPAFAMLILTLDALRYSFKYIGIVAILKARKATILMLFVAVGIELLQMKANKLGASGPARGDWIDLAIFPIMAVVTLRLLRAMEDDLIPPTPPSSQTKKSQKAPANRKHNKRKRRKRK